MNRLMQSRILSSFVAAVLRPVLALSVVLAPLGLAGCLGAVTLVITPSSVIVGVGETVTFTATTPTGTPVTGVTWTLSSGVGSVVATTGVYTAPLTGVTGVVTAVVQATKGTSVGTATVVVRPSPVLQDPIGDMFALSTWSALAGVGNPYATHLGTLTLPQTPTVTYDVTRVETVRTAAALNVTLTVSPAPTLAAAGATVTVNNLAGFVDFDTDENSATGVASSNTLFCQNPPLTSSMGVDFFLSLFARNADGTFNVFNATATVSGTATVAVSTNTVTFSVPLTALGGDDGRLALSTVVGNGQTPNDCAPDQGGAIVTVTHE